VIRHPYLFGFTFSWIGVWTILNWVDLKSKHVSLMMD